MPSHCPPPPHCHGHLPVAHGGQHPQLRGGSLLRWRHVVLTLAGATLSAMVHAQTPTAPAPVSERTVTTLGTAQPRPRIGLVLSGGGARGFAHVGVLKALEAARVPVDVVVGTSMGAIVGGLYASGMSPQALESELMDIAWDSMFDRRAPRQTLSQQQKEADFDLSPVLQIGFRDGEFRAPTGAVSTRSLEWLLRRYTLHTRNLNSFDALPTPFRAVATDMETGEPVVMASGDLAAALRASMSVPGVFSPLELDGRLLGDGGLVNNLPVDVARAMGTDVVIAVNIGTPLASRDTLGSVLGVSAQMINILTEQNVQRSVATLTRQDLLLSPPLGNLTAADFGQAARISALGQAYGESVAEALARFAVSPADYAQWQLERKPSAAPEPGMLAFVRFEGVTAAQAAQLKRLVDTRPGSAIDPQVLAADLLQLSASGDYEQVDYKLAPDPHTLQDGLVFNLKETDWGPNFLKLGIDLHTDFQGEAGFNVRLQHRRRGLTEGGTEWHNQLEIGSVTGLKTELYHPWGGDHDRFVSAHAAVRKEKIDLYDLAGNHYAIYGRRTMTLGLDHGWTLGRGGQLGSARIGLFDARRQADPQLVDRYQGVTPLTMRWSETGFKLNLVADQLDHAHFPQQGYRAMAQATLAQRRGNGETTTFTRTDLQGTYVHTWGRHTLNAYGRMARAGGVPSGSLPEFSLGGFQQISGLKVGEVAGDHLILARMDYYQRLRLNPGVARALFAGGSIEAGNAWRYRTDPGAGTIRTGYSLYIAADTGLGPIYLGWVHSKGRPPSIYLFLGKP